MAEFRVTTVSADGRSGGEVIVAARTAENAEKRERRRLGKEWADATFAVEEIR